MNSSGQNPTPKQLSGRGIVLVEASLGGPSKADYESMARRRYQKPAPRREGQQWVLYFWDDEFVQGERRRKKKRHVLGLASMLEREAEKVRDEFLRPLNQGLVTIGSATKYADFVASVYQPVVLPTLAKSTQDRAMSVYENYLRPAFGEMCLRDITPLTVQRELNETTMNWTPPFSLPLPKTQAASMSVFAFQE